MAKRATMRNAALKQLTKDADEVLHLIKVQLGNLTLPSYPLCEKVLDTQMFELQKEVDFAIKLDLVGREDGKRIMLHLEKELSKLHGVFTLVQGLIYKHIKMA